MITIRGCHAHGIGCLLPVSGVEVEGGAAEARSPLVHVRLAGQPELRPEAEALLQRVADAALKRDGVLLAVARVSPLDKARVAPSLRRARPFNCLCGLYPRLIFPQDVMVPSDGGVGSIFRRSCVVPIATRPSLLTLAEGASLRLAAMVFPVTKMCRVHASRRGGCMHAGWR